MGDATEEKTQEPEPLVLTEREEAIARGEDPDAIGEEAKEEPLADDQGGKAETGQEAEIDEKDRSGGAKEGAWVTEDLKTLAKSYGVSEEELTGFGSESVFRHAAALYDRQLMSPPKKETPSGEPERQVPKKEDELDLDVEAYRESGFDEHSLNLVRYAKNLKTELDDLKFEVAKSTAAEVERERQQGAWIFHSAVDQMDESRYGRLVKDGVVRQLGTAEEKARQELFDMAETLRFVLETRAAETGRPAELPPTSVLLQRAEQLAFGEDIRKQERSRLRERAMDQSKRRRPVPGRGRTSAPPQKEESDPVKAIANHPAVKAFWDDAQAKNGAS